MGTYTVTLTITDSTGATDTATTLVTLERSEGPTASFTPSSPTVMLDESVTFDASGSSSPGASITSYEWEFGDGETATRESVTHVYDSADSYTVALTVTDNIGATDTASTTVTVESSGIDPATTIEFEAQNNNAWTGVAPAEIEGKNPLLNLQAGEEYTLEWTNRNGGFHNFVIEMSDGSTPVATDFLSTEGETQTVTFTATADMTTYYCNPHRDLGMEGSIEIV
jgi:PKD repeat protein